MRLIEWEVAEDGYEKQIIIPKEKQELAALEGINTENKQKVTVQIMNLRTGESYIGRLAITGTHQTRLPLQGTCLRADTHRQASGQVYLPIRRTKGLRPACHSS